MSNTDLPPLPPAGLTGRGVCDTVRLYLAIARDLSPDQARNVSAHLQICSQCAREYQLMNRAGQLVARMEASEPSTRVDQAVRAAIAARSRGRFVDTQAPIRAVTFRSVNKRKRIPAAMAGLVAAAAILVFALFTVMHFALPGSDATGINLAGVSWNSYVLYHSQTIHTSNGVYRTESYHNMANDNMNVETTQPGGRFDVMAVTDGHQTIGMDMAKKVTQPNATSWLSDDSMFDLTQLRKDLQSGQAVYKGKDRFNGQDVYRILENNGEMLLLNMQYQPVNVLQEAHASTTWTPVYDQLKLLSPTAIPSTMWDMTPPAGFKNGTLPAKP